MVYRGVRHAHLMPTVVEQEWWDTSYAADLTYRPGAVLFAAELARFLPRGGTAFEVGCYPGKFLIWLSKELGYTVSGIDLTPRVSALPAYMRSLGVDVGSVTHGDFFQLPLAPVYDLVCSFGFIEHFTNFAEALARHVALVKPGGWLVVSCPNLRRGQFVLHRALDAETLRRHFLPAMDFAAWRRAIEPAGMDVVHQAYTGTCQFWCDFAAVPKSRRWIAGKTTGAAAFIDRHVHAPNPWFSPYMLMVARKRV
jgi:SAM-dependent methyltransferase